MSTTSYWLGLLGIVMLIMAPAAFAQCPGPCEGDLDGDGNVSLPDLAALLARYGTVCDQAWTPDEHTVALWHLNGNGVDFSGNGNDLTIKTDRVGWVDDAPHCRGAGMLDDPWEGGCENSDGGALTAPGANCTYPGNGDWTIEAWVYFPSNSATYTVVSHYSEHVAGQDPYRLFIENGQASFEINNTVAVTADVSDKKCGWFLLTAVYRYQQDAAIWVDGVRREISATTEIPQHLPEYDVYVGGSFCGTSTGLKIDEVKISNVARGRVAYWYCDEDSGNIVADAEQGYDGAASADVVPSADVPPCPAGNLYSRAFPGNYQLGYIEVPDYDDLDLTGDFTLEAWILAPADEADKIVAKHQHGNNSDGSWQLELQSSRGLQFQAMPSGSLVEITSDPNVVPYDWTHVAFTYDESRDHYDFYVDGVSAGSGTANLAGKIQNTPRPLWIGGQENDPLHRSFNGWIDEVQIWNQNRTQTQIQYDMCNR